VAATSVKSIPRILITPGEPAGIGPDVVIQLAQQMWPAEISVIADPALLSERAKQLSLPLTLANANLTTAAEQHRIGHLKIIPVSMATPAIPGILNQKNAGYVLQCLELATDYCLQKKANALVTGPIHKSILNDAGISFTGHTEFLAARCHATDPIMLFVIDKLKVALATTHIPLAEVSKAITHDKLIALIRRLQTELQTQFGILQPKIMVCGLNPHAGENGHLGREEIDTITPALEQLRGENIHIVGPLPADTIFTPKHMDAADVILAMYHDQALPVVKYIGFDRAVNVTLGLPIIRTSVDHGTALDIAGTKNANPGSLIAAVNLAIELANFQT
jgi:4-hydroxythreonine-4-phosphate dehydrogenase